MAFNWSLARKRTALQARAEIIRSIREFFVAGGYLEVDTPLLIPAPAPELHIDAVPANGGFLHTSPELCMKRLLAAGFERLFQICHCWRSGERGSRHLPEFTMLEWYRAGSDYRGLMAECEELLRFVAGTQGSGETLSFRGTDISITESFDRLSVREAFLRFAGLSMEQALAAGRFDEVMTELIEPRLGWERPTFIYDYPACRSALARLKAADPAVAERFELYIGGVELANAFSELTDPVEQRARFVREARARADCGKAAYPVAEKFLGELKHLPSAAGIALGIDRLVLVLTDSARIDDVVAFTPEEL